MLIYVAGPYGAKNDRTVEDNIAAARDVAIALWEAGHYALCPHLNSAHMDGKTIPDESFYAGTMEMLRRCDAVMVLPNSENSLGTQAEIAYAIAVEMPVYRWPDIPPKSLLEKQSPEDCRIYMDGMMRYYRKLHLTCSRLHVVGAIAPTTP